MRERTIFVIDNFLQTVALTAFVHDILSILIAKEKVWCDLTSRYVQKTGKRDFLLPSYASLYYCPINV